MVRGPQAPRLWPFPVRSFRVSICAVLALSGAVFPAASAAGQADAPVSVQEAQRPALRSTWILPPEPEPGLCRIVASERAEGPVRDLRAYCEGGVLWLGPATEFEAIDSPELEATLVDARLGTSRRLLLVSAGRDGAPQVSDLTGQIALAAGRGAMAEIDGVAIDATRFAQTGALGVTGGPQDTGSRRTGTVDLTADLARERAARVGAPVGQEGAN